MICICSSCIIQMLAMYPIMFVKRTRHGESTYTSKLQFVGTACVFFRGFMNRLVRSCKCSRRGYVLCLKMRKRSAHAINVFAITSCERCTPASHASVRTLRYPSDLCSRNRTMSPLRKVPNSRHEQPKLVRSGTVRCLKISCSKSRGTDRRLHMFHSRHARVLR